MKLVTKELLKKLQAQDPYFEGGCGRELPEDELKVVCKFFTPDASWTWYACSGSVDPETGNIQFFGFVDGQFPELGYFWLSDLESVRGGLGLPVERDLYWKEITLKELMEKFN